MQYFIFSSVVFQRIMIYYRIYLVGSDKTITFVPYNYHYDANNRTTT